jgi:hypothetical protein
LPLNHSFWGSKAQQPSQSLLSGCFLKNVATKPSKIKQFADTLLSPGRDSEALLRSADRKKRGEELSQINQASDQR